MTRTRIAVLLTACAVAAGALVAACGNDAAAPGAAAADGSTLAVQLPSGGEARFRVVGTVRALDDNGRMAYVRPARLLAADPGATPQVVVKLARGAGRAPSVPATGPARRGRRARR